MPPPHKIRREAHSVLTLNFLKKPDFTRLKRSLEIRREIEKTVFQQTGHVETVVLLFQQKQKPDDYIDVTIELDDVDITSAETKATAVSKR